MDIFCTLDEDRNVIPCDFPTWSEMFHRGDRQVAYDEINDIEISTVFIGIASLWKLPGHPLVFETMIFGLPNDEEYIDRYATWKEADEGHRRALNDILLRR